MEYTIHEEEYRSKELLEKISKAHLTVCGCGAIGSNLIDNLIRQGFKKIKVIDMDRIEEHNRGTQIWDSREVGALKTAIMKNRAFVSTKTNLDTVPKKLTKDNIDKLIPSVEEPTIVIDSFDNPESRGLLYDYCGAKKIPCLHAGLYQDYAEVIWNETYTVPGEPKGMDVCEYPLARNVILLCVAVTSEVLIKYIDNDEKKDYMITLKDLKISQKEE